MSILELIKISFTSLRANLLRTSLTVLGIVIGISSIIIVFSAGEGIKSLILAQVESFGTNIIETETKIPSTKKGAAADTQSGAAMAQGVQVTTLTLDDMEDINNIPNVKRSYANILSQDQASYENESKKVFLLGASSAYVDIDKSEIDYGRFFTEAEDKSLAQVVVLGSKIKDKLFGDSDPIGKSVKLHSSKYVVIGVMKPRGAVMTMDFDDYVYVPIRTLQKKIMGINHVLYMVHELEDVSLADDTAEEIKYILRANHDISDPAKDDFRVTTMQEMMSMLDTVTGALTLLLLAIVAVSLVVGGVGIMNIMYVIVSERISEIGLRKAVGAKYADIMLQFLTESVLVTLIGGVVGIVLGVIVSLGIAFGAKKFGLDWDFIIPLRAYLTALGFSIVFGIFFGIYPARKAAKMSPMEALRSE